VQGLRRRAGFDSKKEMLGAFLSQGEMNRISDASSSYSEGGNMCDYSLCGIPNRLAVEGEDLVVHRFSTGSMGLASPADLKPAGGNEPAPSRSVWAQLKRALLGRPNWKVVPAVCIPPGAYLIPKDLPEELRRQWRVENNEGVVFVQTSANVNSYRDAIQFQDGRLVRLQDLREGLQFEVVSLAGAFVPADEREAVLR
jgi:hypothetical protein